MEAKKRREMQGDAMRLEERLKGPGAAPKNGPPEAFDGHAYMEQRNRKLLDQQQRSADALGSEAAPQLFAGMVFYITGNTGRETKQALQARIVCRGGVVANADGENVTHFIATNLTDQKEKMLARKRRPPIVLSGDWVVACSVAGNLVASKPYLTADCQRKQTLRFKGKEADRLPSAEGGASDGSGDDGSSSSSSSSSSTTTTTRKRKRSKAVVPSKDPLPLRRSSCQPTAAAFQPPCCSRAAKNLFEQQPFADLRSALAAWCERVSDPSAAHTALLEVYAQDCVHAGQILQVKKLVLFLSRRGDSWQQCSIRVAAAAQRCSRQVLGASILFSS